MWNYSFVLPDIVIVIIFSIFYFTQPRLELKINRAFLHILVINFFTILIDVISSYSLEHLRSLPPFILRLENVIYFILFIQRIICFIMFTIILVKKDMRNSLFYKIFNLLPLIAITFIAILNLFIDTIFCISDTGVYSQGPLYNLIYVCAFYYVIVSILHVIIFRKRLSHWDFCWALAFNCILFLGYVVRFLFPTCLIMDFFTLIAIIIIYLSFENPSLFKDEKSHVFNKHALQTFLDEINAERNPLILGFAIHNYNELREIYSYNQTDIGLALIGSYLKQTFPNLMSFYGHDGRFVLIGKNASEAKNIINKISERFSSSWNTGEDIDMYLEIGFIQVKQDIISYDSNLLFTTILTTLSEVAPQAYQIIDASDITKIQKNMQIKRAIELALEKDSVELFLQPVVDSKTQKLVGAEALARIKDTNGQYIPPFMFIPIAEKNGRINLLGEQMFEKTCKFIKANNVKAMGLSWINVNLSPIQILRKDLNVHFSEILNNYDIPPEMIHLEITEESMIDFDVLQTQMKTMNEIGFRFVLDDYGRGYSNVARMKKCPFINIKLDMEFVWDYFKCKDKILPTLVQTINQMGFTVTAEGIESSEMGAAMRDIGCDYLQGFCYSKPLSANEFAEKFMQKAQQS